MSALSNAVAKLSRDATVTIRGELEYDGSGPRPTTEAETTVYTLRLALQTNGKTLSRTSEGDETKTKIRVWVSKAALDAAELTELPVAPPENADGPPGALIDWGGRRYELVKDKTLEVCFVGNGAGDPEFRAYECEERGPTPPEEEEEP